MDIKNLKTEVAKRIKGNYKILKKSYRGKDLKFYLKQLTNITEAEISLTPIKITTGFYYNVFDADVYFTTRYNCDDNKLYNEKDLKLELYVIKKNFDAKPIENFAIDIIGEYERYHGYLQVMPDNKDHSARESFERDLKWKAEKVTKEQFKARHREECYNAGIFVEKVRPYVSTLRGNFQVGEITDYYAITTKICIRDGRKVDMLIGVASYRKDEIIDSIVVGQGDKRRYISLPCKYGGKNSVEFAMFDEEGKAIKLTKKPFKGYC